MSSLLSPLGQQMPVQGTYPMTDEELQRRFGAMPGPARARVAGQVAGATGGNPGMPAMPIGGQPPLPLQASAPGGQVPMPQIQPGPAVAPGVRQQLNLPGTNQMMSPLAFQFSQIGVSPVTAFDAMQTQGGMGMLGAYQDMANGARSQYQNLLGQLTDASRADTARYQVAGDMGLRTIGQLGAPGMMGSQQREQNEDARRTAVTRDALDMGAQAQRAAAQALTGRIASGQGALPTESEAGDIGALFRGLGGNRPQPAIPGVSTPTLPSPGLGGSNGAPNGGLGAAVNPAGSSGAATQAGVAGEGSAAAGPGTDLQRIFNEVSRAAAPQAAGASASQQQARVNQIITNFLARTQGTPGLDPAAANNFLAQHSQLGADALNQWQGQTLYPWNTDVQHQVLRNHLHALGIGSHRGGLGMVPGLVRGIANLFGDVDALQQGPNGVRR